MTTSEHSHGKIVAVPESSDVSTIGALVATGDLTHQQKAPESETDILIEAEEVWPSNML